MSPELALLFLTAIFALVFVFSLQALRICPLFSPVSRVVVSTCVAVLSCLSLVKITGAHASASSEVTLLFPFELYAALGLAILVLALLWLPVSFLRKRSTKRPEEARRPESTRGHAVDDPGEVTKTRRSQKASRTRSSARSTSQEDRSSSHLKELG